MLWLIVIIAAYFLLALSDLGNKYLLAGPPNPKSYTFYVGTLSILAVGLIPFVDFGVPQPCQLLLALLSGAIYVSALYALYNALENFEVSRVTPAIGGILPLFTFALSWLFFGAQRQFEGRGILAFFLLLIGTVIITWQKEKIISRESLKISILAALLFSISFIFSKFVYLEQPFWQGFIWMRIGGFLIAIFLIFSREVRKEIFGRKPSFSKKTGTIFLLTQSAGAGAFVLQNWAIALAAVVFLPVINALAGTQYIFLFLLITFISLKFPKILKERISRQIIFQKIFAILIIGIGLALLLL